MEETDQNQQQEIAREVRAELLSSARNKSFGCLGYLVGGFLGFLIFTVFFSPWAFYIGGRPTPLTSWEGFGRMQSSTGASYGLYMKLSYYSARRSSRNLGGVAVLCTPQGESFQYDVYGWIEHVWLYTEGKHTKLDLWKVKDAPVNTSFHLEGRWQAGQLVLSDGGSFGKPFRADGSVHPRGIYNPHPIKGEHAEVNIAYGNKFDFDEVCANEIVKR
jgi:hypothetical protein